MQGNLTELAAPKTLLLRQKCGPGQVSECQECKEEPRARPEGYNEDGGKVGVESGLAEASSASYWQTDRQIERTQRQAAKHATSNFSFFIFSQFLIFKEVYLRGKRYNAISSEKPKSTTPIPTPVLPLFLFV